MRTLFAAQPPAGCCSEQGAEHRHHDLGNHDVRAQLERPIERRLTVRRELDRVTRLFEKIAFKPLYNGIPFDNEYQGTLMNRRQFEL